MPVRTEALYLDIVLSKLEAVRQLPPHNSALARVGTVVKQEQQASTDDDHRMRIVHLLRLYPSTRLPDPRAYT